MQALPDRTAASVAQGSDTAVEQHTDHSNDQAKLIQKLRREAYEVGSLCTVATAPKHAQGGMQ
jgi:hypothetical protein